MTLATGSHLFPSRTEKLSPSAPMVLPAMGGRVGRCQFAPPHYESSAEAFLFTVLKVAVRATACLAQFYILQFIGVTNIKH